MKIELQPPFKDKYKQGYLLTNKEPRNLVLLVDFNNKKTSVSYARYLMSCHLNRFLSKTEHVDHIDNNKMNDIIENLQILSSKQNNEKSIIANNKKMIYRNFVCPICSTEFSRPAHNFTYRPGYQPCCSRKCGGIKSHNGPVSPQSHKL